MQIVFCNAPDFRADEYAEARTDEGRTVYVNKREGGYEVEVPGTNLAIRFVKTPANLKRALRQMCGCEDCRSKGRS